MNTATAQPVPLTLPDVPQKTVQKQNAALLPVTADPFRIIKILSENFRSLKKRGAGIYSVSFVSFYILSVSQEIRDLDIFFLNSAGRNLA